MSNEKVVVIGIDPAMSDKKKTVVWHDFNEDGFSDFPQLEEWENREVEMKLKNLTEKIVKAGCKALITWDAPLTGPALSETDAITSKESPFTVRPIEKLFSGTAGESTFWKNPPDGINVQGYSGCQHWTISRNALGLPRMGQYDTGWKELPYTLLPVNDPEHPKYNDKIFPSSKAGIVIAEVHPALGMWLVLSAMEIVPQIEQDKKYKDTPWKYKGNINSTESKDKVGAFLSSVLENFLVDKTPFSNSYGKKIMELMSPPRLDDKLDALFAWLLGKAWVEPEKYKFSNNNVSIPVKLVGNRDKGAMLLPVDSDTHKQMNKLLGIDTPSESK